MLKSIHNMTFIAIAAVLLAVPRAHAHLIVAQHGTLNIVDGRVYMAISIPVSAFDRVDDDGDGAVTLQEVDNHRSSIAATVQQKITLHTGNTVLPVQGLMLSPTLTHDHKQQQVGNGVTQLVAMGQFQLDNTESALFLRIGLQGTDRSEQSFKITVSNPAIHWKHVFYITSTKDEVEIFTTNQRASTK